MAATHRTMQFLFPRKRWCRPARGFTPVAERGELAVKRIGDRSRDYFDACRSAQILMHDEPGRAQCRWFIRPDAHHTGLAIAQTTCELSNAQVICCGSHLDERVIATNGHARALQRLAHKKWARRGRGTGVGDHVEPA